VPITTNVVASNPAQGEVIHEYFKAKRNKIILKLLGESVEYKTFNGCFSDRIQTLENILKKVCFLMNIEGIFCLTPLSTIFQLFYIY
jgi:hypothetical protein